MSKQKIKGTKYESAIVGYLNARDFDAKRQPLSGANDEGDIIVKSRWFDLIIEAKNRKSMSPKWLGDLLDEAETEAFNAEASYGVAVIHRDGVGEKNMGGSMVLMSLETLADLMSLAGM